ncbi:MAG: ABC transporter substrate-binding protein [Flavobacteriales bacterium CG_4_10_14_0_2_um_filter_32_8]|nr:MAG: ABC transporter substrate-binding protein [Flavobacteriales bacterium CG_4_10_14_0_2_um_filter_32_8]
MKQLIFLAFLSIFLSCNSDKKDRIIIENIPSTTVKIPIKYAKGFTIEQFENYKLVTLKNVWVGEKKSYHYILYSNKKPTGYPTAIFIKTPIKSIACMSLTHVAFIEKLAQENSIIALSGCDYVNSTNIQHRIKDKKIKEIGQEQQINYETLVELNPNLIMGFGIDASSTSTINKMQTLGLKVVLNAEYMESHPLGKAEWIKFIAAFYNEDAKAAAIFDALENDYLALSKLTQQIKNKPTVFTGMPWNGAWYVPGAKSYQAQLFFDAGANYLWKDGNESEGSVLKSKEIIVDEALNADFWINLNSYKSIAEVVAFDKKFTTFRAVKNKNLFNNDKRLNIKLGNDYWESGVANPHVVLADLIKIFHPEIIEHELYYYQKLGE